jgi:hypothetical protein
MGRRIELGEGDPKVNAGHLSMVSRPQAVANLILQAAGRRQTDRQTAAR